MNLSNKGTQQNDTKLSTLTKFTNLNPNAAEFVPFSRRTAAPVYGSTSNASGKSNSLSPGAIGKAVLDRSESSFSNNSDEETRQYWSCQLPDDITPDFKVMGEEDSQGLGSLSLAGLSLEDDSQQMSFPSPRGVSYVFTEQQDLSMNQINDNRFTDKMRYSVSSFTEDPNSESLLSYKQYLNSDQLHVNVQDGVTYNASSQGFMNDMPGDHGLIENGDMNPLEFLALQFPGFASESLAEVYFANGCDLNLTIEMLTQLELQVDSGFEQNMNSKTFSAPNLSAMDFPALTSPDSQNGLKNYAGDDHQQRGKENMLMFSSSSSNSSRGATDFASAVRKLASQDAGVWKYDKNVSAESAIGSSRGSHVLASNYRSGHDRSIYGDRLQTRSSGQGAPVWLETGEAVANLYSELREEARDHARVRNAYFEQARQAYLVGDKALAKQLSVKGQLYNMRMKEAHEKAQESIYRQRNPCASGMLGSESRQDRMIDLHGLHVSEAIHVLKHELSILRSTARAAEQRLQVYICVGTGHHTRGSRTPARLPVAVQRYLLEEGIDYSEPQPGLLRVVIY